jgi:hypothetical protein
MSFIGQFLLDDGGGEVRLAYVFMTDGSGLRGRHLGAGRAAKRGHRPARWAGAFFVTVRERGEGPAWPAEDHGPFSVPHADDEEAWQFVGGEPVWPQGDETPGPGWRLVAQLDDGLGHNVGDASIGYLFVSPDEAEGRFPWQCG